MTSQPTSSTLQLLNLPPKSFVGLDLSSFTTTPGFSGITAIPPGLHHIWLSPAPSLSLRTGFWLRSPSPASPPTVQALSKRFEALTETLLDIPQDSAIPLVDPATLLTYRQRDHITETDTADSSQWTSLTSHITDAVLTRILGARWTAATSSSAKADADDETLPAWESSKSSQGQDADEEDELYFTPINLKQTWPPGAVGRERTTWARDFSWVLEQCGETLLGEWELAFVLAGQLGNFSAGQQWHRVARLVLGCKSAVARKSGFFVEALRVLRRMLEASDGAEEGYLAELEGVEKLLREFWRNVEGVLEDVEDPEATAAVGRVRDELKVLKAWVFGRFGWTVDWRDLMNSGVVVTEEGDELELVVEGWDMVHEEGEYAPQIVEVMEEAEIEEPMESPKLGEEDEKRMRERLEVLEIDEDEDVVLDDATHAMM